MDDDYGRYGELEIELLLGWIEPKMEKGFMI
jgi:hypothetical protein